MKASTRVRAAMGQWWRDEGKRDAILNPDCSMIPHANRLFRILCQKWYTPPHPKRYRWYLEGWIAGEKERQGKQA